MRPHQDVFVSSHQLPSPMPRVDADGSVVDLTLLHTRLKTCELPVTAVIMAGGFGARLRPLTEDLPKPMLPVGNRPLLERIIEQLRQAGIRRVYLTTHYKGDIIAQHFGDGRHFGVEIHYLQEERPLGTAGALSLLQTFDQPLLVMNGDILTQIDFRAMLSCHREHQTDMTVAVRRHAIRLPYGVIETRGHVVVGIHEKPTLEHVVNAGIYLLNPDVCRFIPTAQPYDMTDLIACLVVAQRRIVSFPIQAYWQDIGHVEDYQRAITAVSNGEV